MIKKLTFFTFLMLLIPLFTWAIGWQWQIDGGNYPLFGLDFWLFLMTETGSTPYALMTCVLLMLWIMWLTRKRYSWLLVGFICASSVIGTQIIKESVKSVVKAPRPFVTQMFPDQVEQFYALPKAERAKAVEAAGREDNFVTRHQMHEVGYSFPSGHTIFAVSWLLLFTGFLYGLSGQAVSWAQFFAIYWAGLMLVSRLRLGMHYPIDLFVSTLIAWVFHLILFIWVVPSLANWKYFTLRSK